MILGQLNGFEFHLPESGGKAGKGHNVTSTIQVRKGNRIVKQFRFTVAQKVSRINAMRKAKGYAQSFERESPPPHRCMDEVAGFCAVCADHLAQKEAK